MVSHEEELPRSDREWLAKIIKDMYVGNGKASMTSRLGSVEKSVESIAFYGRWLLLTCAGILLVAVLDLVLKR